MKYKTNLTPMQLKAITHGRGNALVSASAGSGKTFVVIERIIRLIIEENVSVSEILAVTFTKLAAQEMKDKLRDALTKSYLETKNPRFKAEIDKISSSDISTIDSFCSKIIKKYFYVLGIDANFQVADESVKKELEQRALDELFERLYNSQDEDFLSLIPLFSNGRSDSGLKQTIKNLYNFALSQSGTSRLIRNTEHTHQNVFSLLTEEYLQEARHIGKKYAEKFINLSYRLTEDQPRKNYAVLMASLMQQLSTSNDLFAFFNCYNAQPLTLPSNKSKVIEVATSLKETVEEFRREIKDIKAVFSLDRVEEEIKCSQSLETIKKLLKIVTLYEDTFKALKTEENLVDFSDIEELTLKLLQNQEIAESIKNLYRYVFVDEYQDVNAVQEEIVNKITSDNAFLVGDSKQSIYAFRGCNPTYFKNKYDSYLTGNGTAISLDNNFRSAKAVIDAVNCTFSPIMQEDFGGTDYKNNPMIYGGGYGDYNGVAELHIVNVEKEKEIKETSQREVYSVINATEKVQEEETSEEVKTVLNIISENLGSVYYDVKEKDEQKRKKTIKFGDICILLRAIGSGSKLGEEIVSKLVSLGVPVSSSVKKGIEDYPEIKVLTNLLSLLVCAERDVPLATVMLSLYGFTENELLLIRKAQGSKKLSFYDCVQKFAEQSDELGVKVKNFINWLDEKRLVSEFLPADEVLLDILKETGYLAKVTASPYGEIRIKRIERFIAESIRGSKKLRVFEFDLHVKKVLEDLTVSESVGEDTVKVMTMHASKGLEFPVVIIAGASKKFNQKDKSGSIINEKDLGVAIKSFNSNDMTVSENAVRLLIKHRLKKTGAVEELRLFYVALTRAKCKLYVTANKPDAIGSFNVYNVNKHSDFLSGNGFETIYHTEPQEINLDYKKGVAVAGKEQSTELTKSIVDALSYVYPHLSSISVPVKSSVSDVNNSNEEEYYKTTTAFGLSSSEKGTAYHRFFELIDFYNYNVESDLKKFIESGLMTERQAQFIDADKIKNVLSLDIFSKIKDYKIYKERKFCQLVPYEKISGEKVDEKVLIQGIIDLVAVKDGKAILIDYKITTIESDDDVRSKYFTQLNLYKNAIESILGVKVEKVYIVNVLKETLIEV